MSTGPSGLWDEWRRLLRGRCGRVTVNMARTAQGAHGISWITT
ncbi:MAG TPA: hypothetical protein VFG77_02330 [Nitrososphaeraceae archaeon]|nr:hypothetical protein [Nitrososphaeraceae archaeon]